MKRLFLLCLIALAGCARAGAEPAPSTTTEPPTSTTTTSLAPPRSTLPEPPEIMGGLGKMNTETFRLTGGRYRSTWETYDDCFYFAALTPGFLTGILNAQGATSDVVYIDGIERGEYYVEMVTGPEPECRWKITLERMTE